MKGAVAACLGGIVFGAGLSISGMADPNKVLAFLTISPAWDPALIFVMGSALLVTGVGYRLVHTRQQPLWADGFSIPSNTSIDGRLIMGAMTFGVGWGLSGYCPGPALVGGFMLDIRAVAFLVAFLVGLFAYELFAAPKANTPALSDG